MGTKRILLFSEIFPPKTGGSGRWFWEIYSRFSPDQIVVLTSTDASAETFDPHQKMKIIRLPMEMPSRGIRNRANFRVYWRLMGQLKHIAKDNQIDVVHCARNLPEGFIAWGAKKFSGMPYFCYVHGEDIGISSTSRELTWMTNRVFGSARKIIANSQNSQKLLQNDWAVPSEKVHLLYPGVDACKFVPAPPDLAWRQQHHWAGRTVLLTVGRLQKRKGHDHLLRAIALLKPRFPQILAVIAGSGEELPTLQVLVRELELANHVRFLGEVPDTDLLKCYQQCDLFVLPNRSIGKDFEGFGMVLLEAQACGKPVLAGASGGTRETMQVGESGDLVDCEQPELLAEKLTELLEQPEKLIKMGQLGRTWVENRFDWKTLHRHAEQLFYT
ncbi:MAG: glycosyltransferase family 4 protein [Zavarzinella sp.]